MNRDPSEPKTLFDKLWDDHVVVSETDAPTVLYIDLHLIHEVTSPQAFTGLESRGLPVRRPDLTVATMDHSGRVRPWVRIRPTRSAMPRSPSKAATCTSLIAGASVGSAVRMVTMKARLGRAASGSTVGPGR